MMNEEIKFSFSAVINEDEFVFFADDVFILTEIEDFDGFIDFDTDFRESVEDKIKKSYPEHQNSERRFFAFGTGAIIAGSDIEGSLNIDVQSLDISVYQTSGSAK